MIFLYLYPHYCDKEKKNKEKMVYFGNVDFFNAVERYNIYFAEFLYQRISS